MKAVFFTREEIGKVAANDERESDLAKAVQAGAELCGDTVEIREARGAYPPDVEIVEDADLVCLMGVKSRHWFTAYAEAGIPWLYFDKGYNRERADVKWLKYMRLSVNSHHPIEYLARAMHNSARANSMGFSYAPWRKDRGDYVVVDGGSEKNFKFNGIIPEDAPRTALDDHCEKVVREIERLAPGRPVIYRPKPSDIVKGRRPISGTEAGFRRPSVDKKDWRHDVERAHCVVTYNGALCVDAHRIGIPSVVIGSGPARPISSTELEDVESPRLATDEERRQWLNNLAWAQFTPGEYADGTAWPIIRAMVEMTPIATPAEACPCKPL